MTIALISPIGAGNALRISIAPPAGAVAWRVLRRTSDSFTGPTDTDAIMVYAGTARVVLDDNGLTNGTPVWYRAYYWDGAAWSSSASATATPQATYSDESTDALSVVRDRLDDGLLVEVQRGVLHHADGAIPVLTAPPVYDATRFPCVTVHLQSEAPRERWIGENATGDDNDKDYFSDTSTDGAGWLAQTQLTIMGWSLNPDERKELRKSIRRILVANLPVFDERGMVNVNFSQQDTEDFESYAAPVYQVMTSFDCLTPILVTDPGANLIADVTQDAGVTEQYINT